MEKLNMKKFPLRLLGALLAALLVLAVFPISALAEDSKVGLELNVKYEGKKNYALEDEQVTVTVSITENPGVASMFLTAKYDTTAFELVSADLKSETFSVNDPDSWAVSQDRKSLGMVNTAVDGEVIFNWIYSGALIGGLHSKRNCEAIGAFAEFKLKVKNADLAEDKYKVTVTPMKENFFAVTESGTGYEEVTVTGLTDDKLSATVDVKKQYSVTYDANGGNGAPKAQTKIEDVDLTLSSDKPTRGGYKFLGWARNENATAKEYDSGDTSFNIDANTTLFAVWQRNASTLAVGESVGVAGGTVTVPVTVGGETMSATKVELTVTAEGLTLLENDGWTLEGSKISKNFDSTTVFASGSKLVNLKFKIPEGATVGKTYTVSINSPVVSDSNYNYSASTQNGTVKVVDYILGDVNGDGYVDAADSSLILQHYVGTYTLSDVGKAAADVNHDTYIDAADSSLILQSYVGTYVIK